MKFLKSLKGEYLKKILLLSLVTMSLTGCMPTKMNTSETLTEEVTTLQTTSEEKLVYEENINYEELTKDMVGKNILFSGYIEGLNEGNNYSQLKVTYAENKNDLVYVKVSSEMMSNIKLEVGDQVLIAAVVEGEYSFNDEILPSVSAKKLKLLINLNFSHPE